MPPPIKFTMMLFFVVNCNLFYFIISYYLKEAGAVIAGFFYNKILNRTRLYYLQEKVILFSLFKKSAEQRRWPN